MVRSLALAGVIFAVLRGPGCGEVDSAESPANAPCTRDKDCASGLSCSGGVCVSPNAGSDASPDTGISDASQNDADADAADASDD